MEVIGFALIAWDLHRIYRREIGTYETVVRLRTLLRRITRETSDAVIHVGAATARAGGSLKLSGRVRRGPGDSLATRVDALETNFGHLETEFDERTAEINEDLRAVERRIAQAREELEQEARKREQERKQALKTSLVLQAGGAALFVAGTVCSVVGNL